MVHMLILLGKNLHTYILGMVCAKIHKDGRKVGINQIHYLYIIYEYTRKLNLKKLNNVCNNSRTPCNEST